MKIRIEYIDGSHIVLDSVQSIELVEVGTLLLDGSTFLIKTFGNDAVRHKDVFDISVRLTSWSI